MRLYEFASAKVKHISTPGWYSPLGEFFPCKYGGHAEKANDIVENNLSKIKKFAEGMYVGRTGNYYRLLASGWVRIERYIGSSEFYIYGKDKDKVYSMIRDILEKLPLDLTRLVIEFQYPNEYKIYDSIIEAEKAYK